MPESNEPWQADCTKLDCGGYVIRHRPYWRSDTEPDRVISVEFECYKIVSPYWDDLSVSPPVRHNEVLMETIESGGLFGNTVSFEKALCFLNGYIKWDGCSNWDFPQEDGCQIHFCGPDGPAEVGKAFEKMYEIAGQYMGDHEWRR